MRKVFDTVGGNFEACREAEEWCAERGITVGQMERTQPRGLIHDACWLGKWSSLAGPVRRQLHGTMTGDMRHGPVVIELKGEESAYPVIEEEREE
ncbi:hypothetical protein [Imbroritus primus]|uniref:hypothetical protein n=1 Tax=Imbroritus primus TaxID=3058603 RepID=UPI003D161892